MKIRGAKQIADFNESFDAYNKKLMYGTEIISVLGKAIDNNKRYGVENDQNSEYYINIEFALQEPIEIFNKSTYSISNNKDLIYDYINNSRFNNDDSYKFKQRTFKCTKVQYNNAGRLNFMRFEQYK